MRLEKARVQNYRSVKDTDWFDLAAAKTILVGPNEAGKTAVLRALEHISPGPLVEPFDPLRDYPRSDYEAFRASEKNPAAVTVASAIFALDTEDQAAVEAVAPAFKDASYHRWVTLGNTHGHRLNGGPRATCR